MTGIERIEQAFANSGKRAALMPYMVGGFPDLERSLAIGKAYVEAGADLIELGVPFSDPLADGPVIHAAATQALANGVSLADVLKLADRLGQQLPVVLMIYTNSVLALGYERFVETLVEHSVSGVIVPDLPFEEAEPLRVLCDRAGVALVPLVAPTSGEERLKLIGQEARGFLYAVSVTGTTGERNSAAESLAEVVARAKAATELPIAVGFGISTPDQAGAAADAGASGVIVGSRLVRIATESENPASEVGKWVSVLGESLR